MTSTTFQQSWHRWRKKSINMSIGPEICWNWVQGEGDDNKGAKVDFIRNVVACEMYNLHAIQIIEEEKRENRTEINEILLKVNFPPNK